MRKRGRLNRWGLALLLGGACGVAHAQWATQSLTLNPGWNAVFLEVQPATNDCDAAFAGIPVESVWAWNRGFSTVQFIQDPAQLVIGQPDWLTYLPADHPARATRNLFLLRGARPYLIKLKSGAAATTWNVVGQPLLRSIDWLPSSLNFVGFPLSPTGAPTFQNFFAGSTAHAGQPIYRLSAAGQWQVVSSPATTTMRSGEAFWVFCQGASTFSGPVQITLDQRDGLIYGSLLSEQTVRIRNNSTSVRSVTIQELASQAPPGGSFPLLAGTVPLSFFRIDAANHLFGWVILPGVLQQADMQPGEEWVLRLAVNRPQMAAFVPPATNNGVLYQSVLNVSDDTGVRCRIAVSSEGLTSYAPTGTPTLKSHSPRSPAAPPDPRAGLWVGNVTLSKVSQPANLTSRTNPLPVGAPLQFRLLVHVDDAGNARLLQKVLEMFKPGTLKPDPANPTNMIVDQPGRYVLVTDDALASNFTGATLRDGELVARRVSSAAFSFPQPIPFTANGAFGAGDFQCQVTLDYDDPVNPFKHVYHPDHNNLDEHFANKLPEGAESFTVVRRIELAFTDQDPDNLTLAGWGDDQLGGNYHETVSGLHSQPIVVSGTFRLTRASTVGVLNDGLE